MALTIILFIILIGLTFICAAWIFITVVGITIRLHQMWLNAINKPIESPWLYDDEDEDGTKHTV